MLTKIYMYEIKTCVLLNKISVNFMKKIDNQYNCIHKKLICFIVNEKTFIHITLG